MSGGNIATESIFPESWHGSAMDAINLKAIHKRYGELKLKSFPFLSSAKYYLYTYTSLGPQYYSLLNFVTYKKYIAMEKLKKEFSWQYYGGKHYESTFTKFYQAYVLPVKFHIDKRKIHLSALIRNGEISREEALQEIALPLYRESELKNDKEFVLKKLGFSEQEFNAMMSEQPVPHSQYPNEMVYINPILNVLRSFRKA